MKSCRSVAVETISGIPPPATLAEMIWLCSVGSGSRVPCMKASIKLSCRRPATKSMLISSVDESGQKIVGGDSSSSGGHVAPNGELQSADTQSSTESDEIAFASQLAAELRGERQSQPQTKQTGFMV